MKKLFLLFLLTQISFQVLAQEGVIKVKVLYQSSEAIPLTHISLFDVNNVLADSGTADEKGIIFFKPLVAGKYSVLVKAAGYNSAMKSEIPVSTDKTSYVNMELTPIAKKPMLDPGNFDWKEIDVPEIEYTVYKIPLIDPEMMIVTRISGEDYLSRANPDIDAQIASVAGVAEVKGGGLSIKGGRVGDLVYYIDDVKIMGKADLPHLSIAEIAVISGGIPARYGDTTGGVVLITTRSSKKSY